MPEQTPRAAAVRAARSIAVQTAAQIVAVPTTARERQRIAQLVVRELVENMDRLDHLATR